MNSILEINTPYYLYDLGILQSKLSAADSFAKKFGFQIHYALKANNNPVITEIISGYGFGADCVSQNEVSEASRIGFPNKKIVFAGVGKTDQEIKLALENDIYCLNCESLEELQVTEQIATALQKKAPVAIRVNPNIESYTHHYITTGLDENKFGIHICKLKQALELVKNSPSLKLMGLHFHIGSQITSINPFISLCEKVNYIWREFEMKNYGPCMLNLGGGLGVNYDKHDDKSTPDFEKYFSLFNRNLNIPSDVSICFELGRSLVAQCGKLITKVLYTKQGINKNFIIVDAGMTELMRPALYQAKHYIENITSSGDPERYDVAGPICESSDVFAKNIILPQTSRGNILAIHSCGAYAESMMLNYNMRPKIKSCFYYNGVFTNHQNDVKQECDLEKSYIFQQPQRIKQKQTLI